MLPLTVATMFAAAEPGRAAEPPAGAADRATNADRGAEVLERLRRRDPDAALERYSGRWRKADRSAGSVPELRPHAPARLRDETPAVPVFRRQDGDDATSDEGTAPENGLNLDVNLDDLNLDDLNLNDLNLDDLNRGEQGLPDDLRLAPEIDDPAGFEAERTTPPSELDRPIREVRDLKDIREILPFGDYDPYPDPNDPCKNLCPRPAGCPSGEGEVALCPEVTPLSTEAYVPRPVLPVRYRWAASNITYNPLYFQDVSLERYGHNYGVLQPVVSVGKFGTQLVGLPYQMALDPPCKCETPLGYYRPGDCAPKLHYQIPLNARAALVQAAAVSGVALILP